MNKSELVSTIARRTEMSEKDVNAVLGEFITVVGEVVAKGQDKLTIPGFISFEQTERKARMGRNPQTGEAARPQSTGSDCDGSVLGRSHRRVRTWLRALSPRTVRSPD